MWWLVVRLNDFCLTWEKIGYAWLNALHVFDVHATCSFLLIQKMINKITAFGRPNKVKLFTVFPLIGQCHFHGLYIFYTKIFNRYRYTKPIHAQNARVSCVELVISSYLNNNNFNCLDNISGIRTETNFMNNIKLMRYLKWKRNGLHLILI